MSIIVGSELTCVKDSNICKSSLQPEWNKGKLVVFQGYLPPCISSSVFSKATRESYKLITAHMGWVLIVTDTLIRLHSVFFIPFYVGKLWIGNFGVKKLSRVTPFIYDRIEVLLVHELRQTVTTKSYLAMINAVSICYYVSVWFRRTFIWD